MPRTRRGERTEALHVRVPAVWAKAVRALSHLAAQTESEFLRSALYAQLCVRGDLLEGASEEQVSQWLPCALEALDTMKKFDRYIPSAMVTAQVLCVAGESCEEVHAKLGEARRKKSRMAAVKNRTKRKPEVVVDDDLPF